MIATKQKFIIVTGKLKGKLSSFLSYLRKNTWEFYVFTLPNWLFFLVSCALLLHYFDNIKNDTTNITNYGFAILAGIASIIFTWARALEDEKDKALKNYAVQLAEQAFHAAILFLIASGLKYVALQAGSLSKAEPLTLINTNFLKGIGNYAASVTFTLAEFKAGRTIFRVNKILRSRLDKDSLM